MAPSFFFKNSFRPTAVIWSIYSRKFEYRAVLGLRSIGKRPGIVILEKVVGGYSGNRLVRDPSRATGPGKE